MRREEICKLAGIEVEEFKSRNKRGELPFSVRGEYQPGAAWMLRAMRGLAGAALDMKELAWQLDRAWRLVGRNMKRIERGDHVYLALVFVRDEKQRHITGSEAGTLAEIEAAIAEQLVDHPFGSDSFTKRGYTRRERYTWRGADGAIHSSSHGCYQVLSIAAVNVSQAYSDLIATARREDIELPDMFPQLYGA